MTIAAVAAALFVFVLATAIATAAFRDVLAAIVVFAAYSLGMAMFYALLLAPDVALTEAAISAGVTTLLLLLTIAKTVRPVAERTVVSPDPRAVIVVALFVLVAGQTLVAMPAVGDADSPVISNEDVSQYYLENAYGETGVDNAVTAVLASYRGFDTFGEAVVVFAAAVAVLLVLRQEVFA